MGNLRDKYKSSSTAKLKSKIQEEDSLVGSGERAGYLSIDEGTNKFRIYPAHDPESGDWYVLVLKHWLTIEGDDGKEKRTTVYNAKHHGGFKKDPCDEYIRMATSYLTDNEDDDAAAKIASLTDWKTGLTASPSWLLYADKIKKENKEFGMLEFNKTTRDGLNKIATFEEEDEAIQSEPFTDPDDGIPVSIVYNSKGKKAGDKYSVTTGTKPKALPLTDEDLEAFDGQKPLNQMYKSYTIDDLTKALEGIKFFDEKFDINFCDTDEWQEKIEELTAMVKSGKGKDSKVSDKKSTKPAPAPAKPTKKVTPPVEDEEEETEEEEEEESPKPAKKEKGDKFTSMDRDELKEFWAENELSETGAKIFKSDTDEQIRVKIRLALQETEEEEVEEEEEEEEEAPKPAKKSTKSVAKKADDEEEEDDEEGQLSLEAIKAKIRKNKAS